MRYFKASKLYHHLSSFPLNPFAEELQAVKESEAKIKQQYSESQRRERILARRVAVQEQEMRDFSVSRPARAALHLPLLLQRP